MSPSPVTELGVVNLRHDTATIQWRVTSLTYDPETYIVEYGTDMNNLALTSAMVTSGNDISVMNLQRSVQLDSLTFNTVYYYRVVATNNAGSTRTPMQAMMPGTFTTTNQGKGHICPESLLLVLLQKLMKIVHMDAPYSRKIWRSAFKPPN